jgi:hypothetical protein
LGEAGDDGDEFCGFDGFDDVGLEAGAHGADAVFGAGVGGEGDGGDVAAAGGAAGADFADEGVAVFAGHADVGDEDVGGLFGEEVEGFVGGGCDADGGVGVLEEALDEIAGVGFVVDDEDAYAGKLGGVVGGGGVAGGGGVSARVGRRGGVGVEGGGGGAGVGGGGWRMVRGSETVNVLPFPGPGLLAATVPPWSSTSCLTMASPSPSPPWRRVVEASA